MTSTLWRVIWGRKRAVVVSKDYEHALAAAAEKWGVEPGGIRREVRLEEICACEVYQKEPFAL